MNVSIVVCTYNRVAKLERLINALLRQSVPASFYELIVVDDCSEDGTMSACSRFEGMFPNFRYVRLPKNSGPSKARNKGTAEVRTDYVLFVDDDCIPATDWVEKTFEALRHHPIIAGAVASPSEPLAQVCHNISEFHRFMPERPAGVIRFLAGANMAFHRDVLLCIGGFDPAMRIAEDMELAVRARHGGHEVFFESSSVVIHAHDRRTMGTLFIYSARNASTTIRLRCRFPKFYGTPSVFKHPVLILLASPGIAFFATLALFLQNPNLLRFWQSFPFVVGLKWAWCFGAARGLVLSRRCEMPAGGRN